MFVVFLFLYIQITTPLPFPEHLDLQKMGEVTFNNEKYNVLKPTIHIITDHFKDSMLRRDTQKIPTKRVFIDKNGFRHYWSGFEEGEVLRKSGLLNPDIKDNKTAAPVVKDDFNTMIDQKSNKTVVSKYKGKRPKRLQDVPLEAITPATLLLRDKSQSESPPKSGNSMTIARTTFFCPFIGVLTMTSRLD